MSADSAIELHSVTKTFGSTRAVDDLSLTVPAGSLYGFIGPNGSGKTTTLRIIMRIFLPDSGDLIVLGQRSTESADDRVSYLPEERGLYKQMKVRDVLRFYSRLKGYSPSPAEIQNWLERMGLPGVGDKRVATLSKGMAQKVQFIAAVLSKPKLVLLDEPFSGLDPINAAVLRDVVLELKRNGTTIVFSTHDMAVAEEMCDFIFMIYQGKKVLDGSLGSIRQKYGTDTLRLRCSASREALRDLPGVIAVNDSGNFQELRLRPDADPQLILHSLIKGGSIDHFELAHPSLRDIFIRIASPAQVKEPIAKGVAI
jgi:ABC-2 type transport system ATP-binding protein